jgi:hypothetical protein
MADVLEPITIEEAEARRVLAAALAALDWARDWRASAQEAGPASGQVGADNWAWYCRGSENAAEHGRRCAEESLRKVLGLPSAEDDQPALQRPDREPEE